MTRVLTSEEIGKLMEENGKPAETLMLRFVDALSSGKLLDTHYTELLTSGKVTTPRPGTTYAYGFEDQTAPDGLASLATAAARWARMADCRFFRRPAM